MAESRRTPRRGSVTAREERADRDRKAYADLAPQKPPKAFETVPCAPCSNKAKYLASLAPWDGMPNWSFDKADARPQPPEKPKPKTRPAPPPIMFTAPGAEKKDPTTAKRELDAQERQRRQRALAKYGKRLAKLPSAHKAHVGRQRMRTEFSGVFQMYCKRCCMPLCQHQPTSH